MSSAHSLHCWQGINWRGQQAEFHKNICTMQLECLMFVNAMSVAMNYSSKLSCMRSSFVYDLACRSINESCISGGPGTLVCLIKPHTTRKKTSIWLLLRTSGNFERRGTKREHCMAGFRLLEKAKLGKVETINPKRGTAVVSKWLHKYLPSPLTNTHTSGYPTPLTSNLWCFYMLSRM